MQFTHENESKNKRTEDFHYLSIYIKDEELKNEYIEYIENHNQNAKSQYPNAGFDLLNPEELTLNTKIIKVDTKIICAMHDLQNKPLNYNLFARSSIVKTNLRLANSVGVIDSGYRGNIIGVFDKITDDSPVLVKYTRLLQICSPTLKPIIINIVNNLEDIGVTDRGAKGFGSSG